MIGFPPLLAFSDLAPDQTSAGWVRRAPLGRGLGSGAGCGHREDRSAQGEMKDAGTFAQTATALPEDTRSVAEGH